MKKEEKAAAAATGKNAQGDFCTRSNSVNITAPDSSQVPK